MLTSEATSTAKLSDLGSSRLRDDLTSLTKSHDVLGTPDYMAPELILYAASAASAQSDQYSLGVALYECVTGHRPFARGSTYETMRSVVGGHVPPPSFIDPSLSDAPDEPLLRAMRCDPSERFPSLTEFAATLRATSEHVGRSIPGASAAPRRASEVIRRTGIAPSVRPIECASHRIAIGELQIVVWLVTRSEPSADAWGQGCALSAEAIRAGPGLP